MLALATEKHSSQYNTVGIHSVCQLYYKVGGGIDLDTLSGLLKADYNSEVVI